MCLAVPGKIIELREDNDLLTSAKVKFGPLNKEINLGLLPEAKIGDYVLVHAGIAISIINESEAQKIYHDLESLHINLELE